MASEPSPAVVAVLKWRGSLQVETGAARASSARLRRAGSVLDALLLQETHDLIRSVRQADPSAGSRDFDRKLVVLAMTLPRLEGGSKIAFAAALGQTSEGRPPGDDDRPRLSAARFGALVRVARAKEWDGLARALRRAVAILDGAPIDVARLVHDLLFLGDETLRRWTYDYWQTLAPPDSDDSQPDAKQTDSAP